MKNTGCQNYMRKEAKDKRNINSRLNQNDYKQSIVGKVTGKRIVSFPSVFSLGWLGKVING